MRPQMRPGERTRNSSRRYSRAVSSMLASPRRATRDVGRGRAEEGRGLHACQVGRVLAQRAGGNDGFLAGRAVPAFVESGNGGDALADPRTIDSLADCLDDSCGFVSEPRREHGLHETVARELVAAREGVVVAVHACRFDARADLARAGRPGGCLFDPEVLRTAERVKTDDPRHSVLVCRLSQALGPACTPEPTRARLRTSSISSGVIFLKFRTARMLSSIWPCVPALFRLLRRALDGLGGEEDVVPDTLQTDAVGLLGTPVPVEARAVEEGQAEATDLPDVRRRRSCRRSWWGSSPSLTFGGVA